MPTTDEKPEKSVPTQPAREEQPQKPVYELPNRTPERTYVEVEKREKVNLD
jgi:hypothetical protein